MRVFGALLTAVALQAFFGLASFMKAMLGDYIGHQAIGPLRAHRGPLALLGLLRAAS